MKYIKLHTMAICGILLLFLVQFFLLTGCTWYNDQRSDGFILKNIAYNNNKDTYTIYVKENNIDTPYLVLTDNYYGNCLLVRKYVLDYQTYYNTNFRYSSYYSNSNIDSYLNNEFFNCISESLAENILTSRIEITSKDSIGACKTDIETIERKIFLLSVTEVGGYSSSVTPKEGAHLPYFSDNNKRLTTTQNGGTANWWLRTPNTWDTNVVYGVDKDGKIGVTGMSTGGIVNHGGIRPCFAMSKNTPIKSVDGRYYILN